MKYAKVILILFTALLITAVYGLFKTEAKEMLNVKVLSIKNCSAAPPTIELVQSVAKEMNVAIDLKRVIVETPEVAKKERFIGSPSVQINGLDIDPAARKINSFGVT
ncbi:MAG: hypothetical protein V3V59_08670 [Thermodesulfovibrionales bacterium]